MNFYTREEEPKAIAPKCFKRKENHPLNYSVKSPFCCIFPDGDGKIKRGSAAVDVYPFLAVCEKEGLPGALCEQERTRVNNTVLP